MKSHAIAVVVTLAVLHDIEPASAEAATATDMTPIECSMCDRWNARQAPFKLHGSSWYVGPAGLSAVLIDSGAGLVLLDGALPQSAALIAANVRELGLDVADIEWIVNSHAHFDHAGGIAALQRMSGAKVAASGRGAEGLRIGNATPDDPQAAWSIAYPPVADVEVIADGGNIAIGNLALVAHYTPGHTPGGVTWTWRSCEDGACIDVVYADSLTPIAAPDFRFTRNPAAVARFQRSLRDVASLPCDLLVSTHPESNGLFARRDAGGGHSLIDPGACRAYAGQSSSMLDKRVGDEAAIPAD